MPFSWLIIHSVQGYNAKDRKGALFEDWDLPESGTTGQSEVSNIVYLLLFSRVHDI